MNGRTNTTSVTEVIEGVQVALEAPTNLVLTPLNARVDLTWTDPVDKYAAPDGQTATNPWDNVATWDHSIVVRKAGSAPTSPDDGELIYTETTRNQHQYTAYSDTDNVINNTEYYYAVYAISTSGLYSDSVVESAIPKEGVPTYETSLSYSSITTAGASIPNYAVLYGGGTYENKPRNSIAISTSNTTQGLTAPNHCFYQVAGLSTPNYTVFGGGDSANDRYTYKEVDAYDTSLTYHNRIALLSSSRPRVVDNGIYFSGYHFFIGNRRENTSVDTIDCFDSSFTVQDVDAYPLECQYAAVSKSTGYMIRAGGMGISNVKPLYSDVYAWNTSLTRSQITGLSEQCTALGGYIGNRMIIFHGGTSYSDGSFQTASKMTDIYDSSLTRSPGPTLVYDADTYSADLPDCYSELIGSTLVLYVYYNHAGPAGCQLIKFDSSLTQTGTIETPATSDLNYPIHAVINDEIGILADTTTRATNIDVYRCL